jgi:hypothetical protein
MQSHGSCASSKIRNLPQLGAAAADVIAACAAHAVSLVVVGPEDPLANGLADALRAAGIAVFGPDRAAAQIEVWCLYLTLLWSLRCQMCIQYFSGATFLILNLQPFSILLCLFPWDRGLAFSGVQGLLQGLHAPPRHSDRRVRHLYRPRGRSRPRARAHAPAAVDCYQGVGSGRGQGSHSAAGTCQR